MRHVGFAVALTLASAIAASAPPLAAQSAGAVFSAQSTPSPHASQSLGAYARGCLAGARPLPETGPTWQAMRLSRNRNWGHPETLALIDRLSRHASQVGWRGLYIGDIGQPRGGPVSGHASHQIGLDVDIWLLPPQRLDLSRAERERLSSLDVRSSDQRSVNDNWTAAHHRILEAAARDPKVDRIFVTPAAKLRMCADAPARDRAWLGKIRPWWGHNTHFHVRLNCPSGTAGCEPPVPLPSGDGCADAVWWVTDALAPPDPNAPAPAPRPDLRLADLPGACMQVLSAQ